MYVYAPFPQITHKPPKLKPPPTQQLKEAEAARLREEAEAAVDARRFLQEEVEALKRALTASAGGAGAEAGGSGGGGDGGGGQGLFEDSVSVRERLARLERENRALKQQLEGALGLWVGVLYGVEGEGEGEGWLFACIIYYMMGWTDRRPPTMLHRGPQRAGGRRRWAGTGTCCCCSRGWRRRRS